MNPQTRLFSDNIHSLLVAQIAMEQHAHNSYITCAEWFDGKGLDGFSKWVRGQAAGELGHRDRIMKFLTEAGCSVEFPPVQPVVITSDMNAVDIIGFILSIEKAVTQAWQLIGDTAMQEGSLVTMGEAQWFLREQMEEETGVVDILERLKVGGDGAVLLTDATLR